MVDDTQLRVTVNGEARQLPAGSSVLDLVLALGCKPQQVAVERNESIVRKQDHAATAVADGDRFEIVTFFGGGQWRGPR